MSKNLKKVMMWLFLVVTPVFLANCNAQQLADIAKGVSGGSSCNNNTVCDTGETAQSCFNDCHCGNFTCEQNMGESNATCATDCPATGQTAAICGNGVVEGSEQCDLGNQNGMPGALCSANCTAVIASVPVTLTSVSVPFSVTASGTVTVTVGATAGKTVAVYDNNWMSHPATETPAASGTYIATFTAPPANGTYKVSQISITDTNGVTYFFWNDGVSTNYVNGVGSTAVMVPSYTVTGGVTAAVISLTSVSVSPASVAANSMITVTVSATPNMSVTVWDSNWWSHPAVETAPNSGTYVTTFAAPGVSGTFTIPEVDVYDSVSMTGVWFYDLGMPATGTYWNSSTGINTNLGISSFTVTGGTTVTPITLNSVSVVNNAGSLMVTVSTNTGKSVTVWDSNWMSHPAMESPIGSGSYTVTFPAQTVNGTYKIPEVDVYDSVAMTTTWFYDNAMNPNTYYNGSAMVQTTVPVASYSVTTGATAITLTNVTAANNAGVVTVTVNATANKTVTVWDSNWMTHPAMESPAGTGTYTVTFPAQTVNGTYKIPEVDVYDGLTLTTTWFYDNAMTTYYNGSTMTQTTVPVASYAVTTGAVAMNLTSVTAANNAGSVTVTVAATANKTVTVWDSSNWMSHVAMENPIGSGNYTVTFPASTVIGTYNIYQVDVFDSIAMLTTMFYSNGINYVNGMTTVATPVMIASYSVTQGVTLSLNSVTVNPTWVMSTTGGVITVTVSATPGQIVTVWDSTWWSHPAMETMPGSGIYTTTITAPMMIGVYKIPEVDVGTKWYWDNGVSTTYVDGTTGLATAIPVASFSVM